MKTEEIRQLLRIATGAESAQGGLSISEALHRLDALAEDASLPRDLSHYLSRRSYVKALEWMRNPDMPHQI